MKLTYWPITPNIVRCALDTPATIVIRPFGKSEGSSLTHYSRHEFNMSATIACTSEIFFGSESAIIQWHDGFIVKTGGEMDVEIERRTEDKQP